jgi:hypothetical protein
MPLVLDAIGSAAIHRREITTEVARETRVRLRKSRPRRVDALIETCMGRKRGQ